MAKTTQELAKQTADLIQLMIATGIPHDMARTTVMALAQDSFLAGSDSRDSAHDFAQILRRVTATENVIRWFDGLHDLVVKAVGPEAAEAHVKWIEQQGEATIQQAWRDLGDAIGAKFTADLKAEVDAVVQPAPNLG